MSDLNQKQNSGSTEPKVLERQRVLSHLERFGLCSNGFQVLESIYDYWWHDDRVVIPFVKTSACFVVPSGPIGPVDELAAAMSAFESQATSQGFEVMLLGVEPAMLDALAPMRERFDVVKLGEQPEWDPGQFTVEGPYRRTLRNQINRARNKGVTVRRVDGERLEESRGSLRVSIEHILGRWLDDRRVSPLRFMVDLEPFIFSEERRYYVAEVDDRLVGFLSAVPAPGKAGWFFEDVIRVPDAPNGTAELLIFSALDDARGDSFVTLGLAPLSTSDAASETAHRFSLLFQLSRSWLGFLYNFDGLQAFKARFKPDRWSPQYGLIPKKMGTLSAARNIISAFIPGSFTHFVFDSFKRLMRQIPDRSWAVVILCQLLVLIPWTIMLANADGHYWFGSDSMKVAWVVFDGAMGVGLSTLAYSLWQRQRIARTLSVFLAGATLTDFLLSLVQAITLHQAVTGWTLLFVCLGVLGPAVASVCLWLIAISGREE